MRHCDATTGDLDATPCDARVVYVCGCSRCGEWEEIDGETFYSCRDHRNEAAAKHHRIYGRTPKWYGDGG